MSKTITGSGGSAAKRKGTRAENIVRAALRERGWLVMRSWSSIGAYDLLGVPPMREATGCPRVYLIEVKNGPHATMGPEARERLIEEAHVYGAIPILAHYSRKVPGLTEWRNIVTGEYVPWPE